MRVWGFEERIASIDSQTLRERIGEEEEEDVIE